MIRATAPAKLNLSLRIRPPDATGYHPLVGLAQSIGWADFLEFEESDEDDLTIAGADLPTDGSNLVWKAIAALRTEAAGDDRPVRLHLTKRVPAAAGLGGGSSDAAAALRLYADHIGYSGDLDGVGASIGADVPFCLHGGLRWIEGYGERLSGPIEIADDYWVVVAVPPIELSTPAVYTAWDRIGGPEGFAVSGSDLPPSLRRHEALINDLYPAAVACDPSVDDWRAELAGTWDRPVLLSGSGPSLFGFFADEDEARAALAVVPETARSAFAAAPIGYGARIDAR